MTALVYLLRSGSATIPCIASSHPQAAHIGQQIFGPGAPVRTNCLCNKGRLRRLEEQGGIMVDQAWDHEEARIKRVVAESMASALATQAQLVGDSQVPPYIAPCAPPVSAVDPERETDWSPAPARRTRDVLLTIATGLIVLATLLVWLWPQKS